MTPAAAGGSERPDVLVVGAGMAGLACALRVAQAGRSVAILEAAECAGGRLATDLVDGFRIDRGFHVLLTAYPEAQALFDYEALELRPFYPGALVRIAGGFARVADPWRKPLEALRGIGSAVTGPRDGLRVAGLRRRALAGTLEELFARPEAPTIDHLRRAGVSDAMIDGFFRPFLGGIFLERELSTSSRLFELVFRMFALGPAAVPANGMAALADQLVALLPPGTVRTGARATSLTARSVALAGGEELGAGVVVLAADAASAAALTGAKPSPSRSVAQLAFAAPEAPLRGNYLVLDGDGGGPVNNLAVISEVAPEYAPPGQALVTASVLGPPAGDDASLERAVRRQLAGWFGADVLDWRLLRVDRIAHALPARWPDEPPAGLIACGDYTLHPSLQGALASGRRAAEQALASLR